MPMRRMQQPLPQLMLLAVKGLHERAVRHFQIVEVLCALCLRHQLPATHIMHAVCKRQLASVVL
jgi:hypothetical protein